MNGSRPPRSPAVCTAPVARRSRSVDSRSTAPSDLLASRHELGRTTYSVDDSTSSPDERGTSPITIPPPNRAVMTTGLDMQPASSSFLARLRHDQAGEGVISTAIAVLIMAIIGGAMWLAFNGVFETAETRITDEVNEIGS